MDRRTGGAISVLLGILLSIGVVMAAEDLQQSSPVLRESDHRGHLVHVEPWDPASPQRLVRLDGKLYQRDSGLLFPVVAETVVIRLADDVADWATLLRRAEALSPQQFGLLARLEPARANKLGIVDLRTPAGSDPAAWAELLHDTGLVRYAEVATEGRWEATQTDPQYPSQWALNNTGQTGGTPGADIKAEAAWDLTAGDPSIVVAVVDSGTDVDHEDLAAGVWHNAGETPGNGVDDDGNGYIDDWEGWDFDHGNNDPRTSFYHGTHVTGIINAGGSNGVGIAGLAGGVGGGPGVRAMALAVGETGPNGAVLDDAILYATDNGARVITMSLSVGSSQAINDALDYAYTQHDVFVDCAAGNSGSSVAYPANQPQVMAVASSTDDDTVSSFSNPGPQVEVAAPGSDILSTQLGSTYGTSSGTSFAAPYVAGLAALIRSRNPGLTAPEVRQLIIDTAVDIAAPGFDNNAGWGRIDAFAAVSGAASSNGLVGFGAAAYACNDMASVSLSDTDLAGSLTVNLTVTGTTEPAGETVTLTESGSGSGIFRGTLSVATGAPMPDGTLQVADGDVLTVEYLDADDGMGGTDLLKSATATIDCQPPVISGVWTPAVLDTSATIAWITDEPADAVVRFGTMPPPGMQRAGSSGSTINQVTLTGLTECTDYVFEAESTDLQGNTAVDDNGGSYFTFQTYGNIPGAGIVPCNQGQVELDRDTDYGCSDTVGVAAIDVDLGSDPGLVESATVRVSSTSEPDGEPVTVQELGLQSNRFEGSIGLTSAAAVAGDGLLTVGPGDLITATYVDPDNGLGESYVATDVAYADCEAPFISGIQVTGVTASRATISWTTSEPATSRVLFGPTAALGDMRQDLTLKTSHSLTISPFQGCDRVWFAIESADAHGDLRVADAGGSPFAFSAMEIGGLVFQDNFESDTGWSLQGDWERAAPLGLGSDSADPAAAYSGTEVLGNDLSGQGANPGDYEPMSDLTATSPSFSTQQQTNLELLLARKLGVTSQDEASIEIVNGSMSTAWTSGGAVNDGNWLTQRVDISALADNQSSVQLQFRIQSSDADHSFGWNVDEVIVKDATQPDYRVCGGCGGAPTFGGITMVVDPYPCTGGLVAVFWDAATTWGTGTTGTYDVYRGTTPDFLPDATHRIASGVSNLYFFDTTAPRDVPIWYAVRARNDEICANNEGLEDGNLLRTASMDSAAPPLPSPVGDALAARLVGGTHVRLDWAATAGADRYIVRRATSVDFSNAVAVATPDATLYEDLDAGRDPGLYLYKTFAVDACGREE